MESENDSFSSGKMHEKTSAHLQRRRSLKRKEAARRNLIDSINSRQSDVRLSVPCFSGERIKSEIKFPRLNSKEKPPRGYLNRYAKSDNKTLQNTNTPSSYLDITDESGRTDSLSRNDSFGNYRKSSSKSINLPGIIMEFNLETSMATGNADLRQTTDFYDDERALGAPYEEYLKRANYNQFNPCKSRYRPVTPGLLESLNKLKLPSKVRTEQWVKSTLNSKNSLKGHVYKTENIDNTNLAFPNWIYSD